MSCRVVIEERHKHHRRGNHFHISVDVTVRKLALASVNPTSTMRTRTCMSRSATRSTPCAASSRTTRASTISG
jgi:hypothetical protein